MAVFRSRLLDLLDQAALDHELMKSLADVFGRQPMQSWIASHSFCLPIISFVATRDARSNGGFSKSKFGRAARHFPTQNKQVFDVSQIGDKLDTHELW